jgi:hypothetical protein
MSAFSGKTYVTGSRAKTQKNRCAKPSRGRHANIGHNRHPFQLYVRPTVMLAPVLLPAIFHHHLPRKSLPAPVQLTIAAPVTAHYWGRLAEILCRKYDYFFSNFRFLCINFKQ